jgi:hypothetical protein
MGGKPNFCTMLTLTFQPPSTMLLSLLFALATQSAQWQDWKAVGPFPLATDISPVVALQQPLPPEDLLVRIRRGGKIEPRGKMDAGDGTKVKWLDFPRAGNPLNLNRYLPTKGQAVGYLFRSFDYEGRSKLPMELTAGGAYKVWLNGEVILEQSMPVTLAGSVTELQLAAKPGRNTLLVKVVGGPGNWAFGLRTSFRWEKQVADLQPKIHAAIDHGVEYLLGQQLVDGSWETHSEGGYPGGVTPLMVYTLLKCGVGPDHPAVRRALLYLRQFHFNKTYSAGFMLLALAATDDPQHKARAQEICEWLVETLPPGKVYGYPGSPDISNHVVAALGVSAASRTFDIKVDPEYWADVIEGTLDYRAKEEHVVLNDGTKAYERGFTYRKADASGSMTSAGITVLHLALEQMGKKAPSKLRKQCEAAMQSGLVWLGNHWSVTNNPPNRSWHYFQLYGLERIGSLLDIGLIGGHPWYLEGAQYLVKNQSPEGTWSEGASMSDKELSTCMGLLFLKRATSMAVTIEEAPEAPAQASTDAEANPDVVLKASGDTPMTFWVADSRVAPTKTLFFASELGQDSEVLKLGKGQVLAGRPTLRFSFPRSGKWQVWCELETPVGQMLSPKLEVQVHRVLTPEMLDAASHWEQNLLRGNKFTAKVSSNRKGSKLDFAFDGKAGSSWKVTKDDVDPWVFLELEKGVRGQSIWFTSPHARTAAQGTERPSKLLVIVNKRDSYTVDLADRALHKTELVLPKKTKIRQLEVHIQGIHHGQLGQFETGLAEIEILP